MNAKEKAEEQALAAQAELEGIYSEYSFRVDLDCFLSLCQHFVLDAEYKKKSQAQFEQYEDKVKILKTTRDTLVSAAQPILQTLVPVEEGASPISITH
uniref:Uncharacterized protein n=1 Tax=Arundo donax TaxID=35708 RepID=A0A0A8YDY0_ARUDO